MRDRVALRRRVLKAGTIAFGGGGIDCVVRNLSNTGAALEVTSPIGVPQDFNLLIPNERPRPSHVVWRRETRIGIAFSAT